MSLPAIWGRTGPSMRQNYAHQQITKTMDSCRVSVHPAEVQAIYRSHIFLGFAELHVLACKEEAPQ